MRWVKILSIMLPGIIAAALNVTIVAAPHYNLYREHYIGLGFLFAAPWIWLLENVGFQISRVSRSSTVAYTIFLWLPAVLYSLSARLLWTVSGRLTRSIRQSSDGH